MSGFDRLFDHRRYRRRDQQRRRWQMAILSKTESNVQESSVNPYLLQPIRSLDEAQKEIEAKRSANRDDK
jgi:hypothetical protein